MSPAYSPKEAPEPSKKTKETEKTGYREIGGGAAAGKRSTEDESIPPTKAQILMRHGIAPRGEGLREFTREGREKYLSRDKIQELQDLSSQFREDARRFKKTHKEKPEGGEWYAIEFMGETVYTRKPPSQLESWQEMRDLSEKVLEKRQAVDLEKYMTVAEREREWTKERRQDLKQLEKEGKITDETLSETLREQGIIPLGKRRKSDISEPSFRPTYEGAWVPELGTVFGISREEYRQGQAMDDLKDSGVIRLNEEGEWELTRSPNALDRETRVKLNRAGFDVYQGEMVEPFWKQVQDRGLTLEESKEMMREAKSGDTISDIMNLPKGIAAFTGWLGTEVAKGFAKGGGEIARLGLGLIGQAPHVEREEYEITPGSIAGKGLFYYGLGGGVGRGTRAITSRLPSTGLTQGASEVLSTAEASYEVPSCATRAVKGIGGYATHPAVVGTAVRSYPYARAGSEAYSEYKEGEPLSEIALGVASDIVSTEAFLGGFHRGYTGKGFRRPDLGLGEGSRGLGERGSLMPSETERWAQEQLAQMEDDIIQAANERGFAGRTVDDILGAESETSGFLGETTSGSSGAPSWRTGPTGVLHPEIGAGGDIPLSQSLSSATTAPTRYTFLSPVGLRAEPEEKPTRTEDRGIVEGWETGDIGDLIIETRETQAEDIGDLIMEGLEPEETLEPGGGTKGRGEQRTDLEEATREDEKLEAELEERQEEEPWSRIRNIIRERAEPGEKLRTLVSGKQTPIMIEEQAPDEPRRYYEEPRIDPFDFDYNFSPEASGGFRPLLPGGKRLDLEGKRAQTAPPFEYGLRIHDIGNILEALVGKSARDVEDAVFGGERSKKKGQRSEFSPQDFFGDLFGEEGREKERKDEFEWVI